MSILPSKKIISPLIYIIIQREIIKKSPNRFDQLGDFSMMTGVCFIPPDGKIFKSPGRFTFWGDKIDATSRKIVQSDYILVVLR